MLAVNILHCNYFISLYASFCVSFVNNHDMIPMGQADLILISVLNLWIHINIEASISLTTSM